MTENDLSPRQRALAGEFVKEGHPMEDAIQMAARCGGVAQGQRERGGPVAWQYREKMPNGAWGIWRHCDIVREDPTLEYRGLYLGAAQAGREVSDERALDLARRILNGQFTTEDAAVEIMMYATDCIEQEKGHLDVAYSSGNCGTWQPIDTAPKDRVIVARNANDDRFHVWWQDAAFKGFPIPGGIFCVPLLTEWSPSPPSTPLCTPGEGK